MLVYQRVNCVYSEPNPPQKNLQKDGLSNIQKWGHCCASMGRHGPYLTQKTHGQLGCCVLPFVLVQENGSFFLVPVKNKNKPGPIKGLTLKLKNQVPQNGLGILVSLLRCTGFSSCDVLWQTLPIIQILWGHVYQNSVNPRKLSSLRLGDLQVNDIRLGQEFWIWKNSGLPNLKIRRLTHFFPWSRLLTF